MVLVGHPGEGPTLVIGSKGENILAVTAKPSRIVAVPTFTQGEGARQAKVAALLEAAEELLSYEPEVHVVTVEKPNGAEEEGMFVAPKGAEITLTVDAD